MMRKSVLIKSVYALTALVVLFNTVCMVVDAFSFNMNDLPEGKKEYSSASPDGTRILNVYKVDNSLGTAYRIELEGEKASNVFWQTGIDDISLVWIDSNVISVNDILINIAEGGNYDCRRGMSILLEGSIDNKLPE